MFWIHYVSLKSICNIQAIKNGHHEDRKYEFMLFEITLTMGTLMLLTRLLTSCTGSSFVRSFYLLRSSILAQERIGPNIWQICAHVSNTNTHTHQHLPFKHPMFHFRHKSIIANILFGHTCSYSLRDLYDFYR